MRLHTKENAKNGSYILQIMEFKKVKHERDDLHTLKTIFPSSPENVMF